MKFMFFLLIAMKVICEAYSDLSKGDGFSLNTEEFIEMFKHVAAVKGLKEDNINDICDYLEAAGGKQGGMLSYENFKADLCPPFN